MKFFLKFIGWLFFFSIITELVYADNHVVEDVKFYKNHDIHRPTILKGKKAGYLELHIAPANEEGISINFLKKLDTRGLKGLLIVNSIDAKNLKIGRIGSVRGNKNLINSLASDKCAKKIIIEVSNQSPASDTYLQGLIRVIGKKAIVEIVSTSGVSISGVVFRNMQEVHIKSRDERHYDDCIGDCARNIRVNSKGIDADCPVFFYSKHAVVDGAIRIPKHDFTLITGSACLFSKNAKAIELGGIKANCTDTFLNQGNLEMTGAFYVDTGEFRNLPHWEKKKWTQQMIDNLDSKYKLDYFHGPEFINFFEQKECFAIPWDDIKEREYDEKAEGTGVIKANHFKIFARGGDFLNEKGGKISDHGGKDVTSTIIALGQVLNRYRQCATEYGYFKDGFRVEPSILEFSGNAIIHSEINRILTDASIVIVAGDSFKQAGTFIESRHFKESFLKSCNYKYGGEKFPIQKYKKVFGGMPRQEGNKINEKIIVKHSFKGGNFIEYCSDRYEEVFFPTIVTINGNSVEIAGKDILRNGSFNFVGGNTYYKAEGNYILKGIKIKVKNQEKILEQIGSAISNGKSGSDVVLKHAKNSLKKQTKEKVPVTTIGGIESVEGKVIVKAKKDVKINEGILFAKDDATISAGGKIEVTGKIDSYVSDNIDEGDHKAIVHSFVKHTGAIASNGDIHIESPEMVLVGATISAEEGITLIVGTLHMEPVTKKEEDYYMQEKEGVFRTKKIEQRRTTTETSLPSIYSKGEVNMAAETIKCKGCIIHGEQGGSIQSDKQKFEVYEVPQYVNTDVKIKGVRLPGIFNVAIDAIEGESISDSVKNNIAIIKAINELRGTKSITDLKPPILFAAEAYTMANNMASKYQTTGSGMAAIMGEALNQFGVTTVNGIPIPTSLGFGKTKTRDSKRWSDGYAPKISGKNFNITAREAFMHGLQFDVDENFNLRVKENLFLKSQPMESDHSSVQKDKSITVSYDGDALGVSGTRQISKSNSNHIRHALPEILAGKTVTIEVGGNAEIEGSIKAPKIKVQVAGTLTLRTKQNLEEGSSLQQSANLGVSYSPKTGVTPSGGFHQGNGDWYKSWADEQTKIEGKHVEISADKLVLEGAAILGKMGYVDAESIKKIDLKNIREEHFSSFGVDTNFVKFLIKPQNAQAIVNTANAIKGMGTWSDAGKSSDQELRATISKNLKIKTKSNIKDLNRDESKTKGEVHKKSHTFSLAVPVVDTKQLAENLGSIGMTVKEINQKMQDTFERAKQQKDDIQTKINIEEAQAKYNEIAEKIEQADISEAQKIELTAQIILRLSEDKDESKEYLVFIDKEDEDIAQVEKGEINIEGTKINDDKTQYVVEDGVLLKVNEVEEHNKLKVFIGNKVASEVQELIFIISKNKQENDWNLNGELFPGKYNIRIVPVNVESPINEDYVELGHLNFNLFDEAMKDMPPEEIKAFLSKEGKEFIQKMWDGVKKGAGKAVEVWNHPRTQGTVEVLGGVGEMAAGAAVAIGASETGIGVAVGAAIVAHGADTVSKGFAQAVGGKEEKSCTVQGLEFIGVPQQFAEPINTVISAAGVIGGARAIIKESIETAATAAGKQAKGSVSKASPEEVYPKGIGLAKREVNAATNPLKLKQIPASVAKEFEGGGAWIMTERNYDMYFVKEKYVGRPDGQFMISSKKMDQITKKTGGDPVKLQALLGINGLEGKTLYRIDIKNPMDYNPRIPHAGLSGANEDFIYGGLTKGGISEIITDLLPKSQATATKIN